MVGYLRIILVTVVCLLSGLGVYASDNSEKIGNSLIKTKCFLIGDFNNWCLPKVDQYGNVIDYAAQQLYLEIGYSSFEFRSGSISFNEFVQSGHNPKPVHFLIYVPNGELKGFYGDGTYESTDYYRDEIWPICMNKPKKWLDYSTYRGVSATRELRKLAELDKSFAFEVENPPRGNNTVTCYIDADNNTITEMKLEGSPKDDQCIAFPEKMYWIHESDGNPEEIELLNDQYAPRYELYLADMKSNYKMLFSSEKSLEPDAEYTYGALYPGVLTVNQKNDEFIVPLVPKGYPIEFNFESSADMSVDVNLYDRTLRAKALIVGGIEPNELATNRMRYENQRILLDYPARTVVYDMMGNIIKDGLVCMMDLSDLTAGLYVVKTGSETLKIAR